MVSAFNNFKGVLLVMLFYSVAMTLLTYALPTDVIQYTDFFSDSIDEKNLNYNDINSEIQGGLDQQSNVPLVEVGALVFYSGNIVIDLIINFVTAIPQMIALLINAIATLFGNGLDIAMLGIIESFAMAAVTIYYLLALIQLSTNIRSGRVV